MASDTYKAHIKRVPSKAGVKTVPLASIVVARGMAEGRGPAFILPSLTHCTMYIPQSADAMSPAIRRRHGASVGHHFHKEVGKGHWMFNRKCNESTHNLIVKLNSHTVLNDQQL